jgi:glycosyl-4,4'-diaponeurosporenoate acyltransferase
MISAQLPLSDGWAVVVSSVAWPVTSVIVGYAMHRVDSARLRRDTVLTRLRRVEDGGRVYDRSLGVRRWKDRLPEAGALFDGGVSKREIGSRTDTALEGFVIETRRAEYTHWIIMASGPLHFFWCPPWLGAFMVAFGVAFNLPCLLVQRYNRGRLQRVLARRARVHP